MAYTFQDSGNGSLLILVDGVFQDAIAGAEVRYKKNVSQNYVELSDGQHIFYAINISDVSGAVDLDDILDAIEAALPDATTSSSGGGSGVDTFSALTDAYDLSGADDYTIPINIGGVLFPTPLIEEGVTPIIVDAATTTALPGTPVYNNGTAGVGATLTRTGNGAFPTVDNVAAGLNKKYLVKNFTGANRYKNGLYGLTVLGGAGASWVLTRLATSDETSEFVGQVVIPSGGTVNGRRVFSQTTVNPDVGTSPIVYAMGSTSGAGGNIYSDGRNDFTDTQWWKDGAGNNLSIDPFQNINMVNAGGATASYQLTGMAIDNNSDSASSVSSSGLATSNYNNGTTVQLSNDGSIRQGSRNAGVNGSVVRKFIKVQVTNTQIRNLTASGPVTVVPSEGAGTIIKVRDVVMFFHGAVAYDAATLVLISENAGTLSTDYQFKFDPSITSSTSDKIVNGTPNSLPTNSIALEADGIDLAALVNPRSSGTGAITLYISYDVITL